MLTWTDKKTSSTTPTTGKFIERPGYTVWQHAAGVWCAALRSPGGWSKLGIPTREQAKLACQAHADAEEKAHKTHQP